MRPIHEIIEELDCSIIALVAEMVEGEDNSNLEAAVAKLAAVRNELFDLVDDGK